MLNTHYDEAVKKGHAYRKPISIARAASPMYPPANELYGLVRDIVWSARKTKAAKEGKTLEHVVRDEIRLAIGLGADIDPEQGVKNAMAEYEATLRQSA